MLTAESLNLMLRTVRQLDINQQNGRLETVNFKCSFLRCWIKESRLQWIVSGVVATTLVVRCFPFVSSSSSKSLAQSPLPYGQEIAWIKCKLQNYNPVKMPTKRQRQEFRLFTDKVNHRSLRRCFLLASVGLQTAIT